VAAHEQPEHHHTDEMAVALDSQAPVTPAKFLPYKKVLDELISIQSIVEEDAELFAELASLFDQTTTSGDSHTHLASLGRRLARSHADTLLEIVETSTEVTTSAKRTMPRKRWDDDGCPTIDLTTTTLRVNRLQPFRPTTETLKRKSRRG
jgi:hypothetical protein